MNGLPWAISGRRRVLGLFAKRPVPGQVKTRLATATSPEWAARAAEAFLHDTLARLAKIDGQRVLAYAPGEAEGYFTPLAEGRFRLVSQGNGNLGQRMAGFFAGQMGDGPLPVVLLGTDSPTLPLAVVEQAFAELERADIVLGPAADGGYYLLGCSRFLPLLFEAIAWSSSRVLEQTVSRIKEGGGHLAVLPPWYDVDSLDDWFMLRGHLAALRAAGVDPGVPYTERLVDGP